MLIRFQELTREDLHVALQFLDLLRLRVVVLHGPVGDRASTRSVGQGAVVLGEEDVGWMQAGNHAAESIASYTLSEQARQLRIPVRHVYSIGIFLPTGDVVERRDHLPQREQRPVDFDALLLSFAVDFGVLLPL